MLSFGAELSQFPFLFSVLEVNSSFQFFLLPCQICLHRFPHLTNRRCHQLDSNYSVISEYWSTYKNSTYFWQTWRLVSGFHFFYCLKWKTFNRSWQRRKLIWFSSSKVGRGGDAVLEEGLVSVFFVRYFRNISGHSFQGFPFFLSFQLWHGHFVLGIS